MVSSSTLFSGRDSSYHMGGTLMWEGRRIDMVVHHTSYMFAMVAARRRRRQAWKCDGRCIAWLKVVPIELHIIHVHRVRFNPKGLYGSRIYSSDASVVEDNLFEDLTSRIGS
ncbi:uncharacterized protein [Panulirus ornatus]|uniref:uncharacterized protein isoform X2 n=1 Tax=Panulirus ornatus TaxID=150431 RepID=UPI003A85330E